MCALRAVMRQRDMPWLRSQARHVQHMQKALTQMNIQLANVISDIVGETPLAREQTMTRVEDRARTTALKELLERDEDFVRSAVQSLVQAALEAEMTEALAAEKGERTDGRLGYRSGYYSRALITRVGTLELRVPQDRSGRFSTELFERYQRSEKALVGTLAEMYVQGVSTRKVKAVTEALCGHSFSASSISAINKGLDEGLRAFSERRLDDAYPYLILDARYEGGDGRSAQARPADLCLAEQRSRIC